MTPDYELLKHAYAIIDGIPEKNFRLLDWVKQKRRQTCGTIACAGGWLAQHPDFKARGLQLERGLFGTYFPTLGNLQAYAALGKVFGLEYGDALEIFYSDRSPLDAPGRFGLTDKECWKARVRKFLAKRGQLGPAQ
jgi:hypothetical protein